MEGLVHLAAKVSLIAGDLLQGLFPGQYPLSALAGYLLLHLLFPDSRAAGLIAGLLRRGLEEILGPQGRNVGEGLHTPLHIGYLHSG